jgi:crotonobetainyl-CoA:carnitine CoA-transferase CaiB-like acyl-CoA transferase
MERLGFGYDDLSKINPRIIVAYSSGYGQTGPYKDRPGQDLLAQATGGLAAITGHRDGPPTAVGTYVADYLGGMFLAMGIMIALAAREKTGRGQVVDSCLLNAAIAFHLMEDTDYLITGKRQGRPPLGVCHYGVEPLYAIYQTGDGKWLATAGGFVPDPWRRTCLALEMGEELANDPRYQTFEGMVAHLDTLQPLLAQAFKKFTRDEAIRRLETQELNAAPVNEQPDIYSDPQVLHNEMVLEFDQPGIGRLKTVGIPIKLSQTPGALRLPPPTVGQHNEEMLAQLGYSPADMARLQSEGAVGAENLKAAHA